MVHAAGTVHVCTCTILSHAAGHHCRCFKSSISFARNSKAIHEHTTGLDNTQRPEPYNQKNVSSVIQIEHPTSCTLRVPYMYHSQPCSSPAIMLDHRSTQLSMAVSKRRLQVYIHVHVHAQYRRSGHESRGGIAVAADLTSRRRARRRGWLTSVACHRCNLCATGAMLPRLERVHARADLHGHVVFRFPWSTTRTFSTSWPCPGASA